MGYRPSCRSCRHCVPPNGGEMGWCQLRRLAIHPDLASELWCHHWSAPAAALLSRADGTPKAPSGPDLQLALADWLN